MRMRTDIVTSNLNQQALADLLKRGRSGHYVYAIIWFVIAAINQLQYTHVELMYCNLALFVAVGTVRAALTRLNKDFMDRHYKAITRVLEICVCAQSLHFGLLTTYIYHHPDLQPLVFPMVLAAAGIVAAGTTTMGVNKHIRLWYPGLMIAPFFVSFAFYYSQTNFVLACVLIIFFVYIESSTRFVYLDYWSSKINSAMLLEKTIELTARSVTDPLTKLHNRAYFNEHLDREWNRAYRNQQSVAVMFVDLDYFKSINDKFGHAAGDLCLIQAGELLAKYGHRAGDAVARYGGEEFVLFFADTDANGAAAIADKICREFRAMTVIALEAKIELRCSIGICCCTPDSYNQKTTFLSDADKAMYSAKKKGRDRFEIYQRDDDPAAQRSATRLQRGRSGLIQSVGGS
mgnify:CR=1 FL=1